MSRVQESYTFVSDELLHCETKRASWEAKPRDDLIIPAKYRINIESKAGRKERLTPQFTVNLSWKLSITSDTQRDAKGKL
jgi:hypothetical protein